MDHAWRIQQVAPMPFDGGDFGLVGQSYTAADPRQDSQRTLNWYTEFSQDEKSRNPTALLGVPGLNPLFSVSSGPTGGEVRGAWVLPGGTRALIVCGSSCAMATMTVPATQTSIAQFSVTIFGTLNTNNGPVCIRDNGIGGYAMIVDGPYGYLVNLTTLVLTQITDAGFTGADRVVFIDGWWIFNRPGSQAFATSGPTPYTTVFPSTFFALKDSSSDNLVTLHENNRELWLVGERASEVWYNAGGANFSFSRIPGVAPQIGCAAKHSIARLGAGLGWLARSERGENIVIQTNQYSYETISTQAVSSAISSYPLVSDAIAFVYEEEEHLFYVLTFPTADRTWVYDATSSALAGRPQWHERGSFTSATGVFHRARANCFINFQNLRMVGDYLSGYMHQMSRSVFTDAGFDAASGLPTEEPLIALRRTPTLWSRENRKRLFHSSIQIDFRPGVGLTSGQGENPQAMLRWSDDAGESWGNEHWTAIGKTGKTKNRAIWRKLGQARDRVYEVSISDPVRRDVTGATLFAEGE
jgi:hypothetical protein